VPRCRFASTAASLGCPATPASTRELTPPWKLRTARRRWLQRLLTVRTLRRRAQAAPSWMARCEPPGRGAAAREEKAHAAPDQQQRCRFRDRRRRNIAELQAEVLGPPRVAACQCADRGHGDQKIVAARLQGARLVPVDRVTFPERENRRIGGVVVGERSDP